MNQMDVRKPFSEQLKIYQAAVENALDQSLKEFPCRQQEVLEAMRYSLLGGGKRIRAILVLEFAKLGGVTMEQAMPAACALEMIQAYSLIHDDLPCMDDDDLRRGKASCHIKFGEATALLAGDGLLTCAFETLCRAANSFPAQRVLTAIQKLSQHAGYRGMIGGQMIDLKSEGKKIDEKTLEEMYTLKTAALLKAACASGCLLSGRADLVPAAEEYAQYLGLAFQIVDDILDITGDQALLGKPIGSDSQNDKNTYVTLLGLEKAKELAKECTQKAQNQLIGLGAAPGFLENLTDVLLNRLQ